MNKLPILVSYEYWTKQIARVISENRDSLWVLLDSGAFTAYTKGKEVDLSEYHKFLKENEHLIDEYIQLDVIGNPERTVENLELSRAEGFNPIPVFTRGMKMDYLDKLKGDRFCIGGMMNQDKMGVLNTLLNYLPNPNQVHCLGVDQLKIYTHRNPPFSTDASNWVSGLRFGSVPLLTQNGATVRFTREIAMNPRHKDYRRCRQILRSMGFMIEEFRTKSEWVNTVGTLLQKVSAVAGFKRVQWVHRNFGKKMFLVLSGGYDYVLTELILDSDDFKKWQVKK